MRSCGKAGITRISYNFTLLYKIALTFSGAFKVGICNYVAAYGSVGYYVAEGFGYSYLGYNTA